jgi:hypothetical protein
METETIEKEKQPQTGDILKESGKLNRDCLHQDRTTQRERERETPPPPPPPLPITAASTAT